MAEVAVIGFMVSMTGSALGVLGILKRRFGALRDIANLVNKCGTVVKRIQNALRILEQATEPPRDVRCIAGDLRERKEELTAITMALRALDKGDSRARWPMRFLMAQGMAKSLASIHSDLQFLEVKVGQLVVTMRCGPLGAEPRTDDDEMETVDCTSDDTGSSTSSEDAAMVNRQESVFVPSLKLSKRDMRRLVRYGHMDESLIADALYDVFWYYNNPQRNAERNACKARAQRKALRYLLLAADLHHTDAHCMLGFYYQLGVLVEQNDSLSVAHYKVACAAGHLFAARRLWQVYDRMGAVNEMLKHVKIVADVFPVDLAKLAFRMASGRNMVANLDEAISLCQRLADAPLFESFCLFISNHAGSKSSAGQRFNENVWYTDDHQSRLELSRDDISFFIGDYWCSQAGLMGIYDFCLLSESTRMQIEEWLDFLVSHRIKQVALLACLWHAYYDKTGSKWKKFAKIAIGHEFVAAHVSVFLHYSKFDRYPYRARHHLYVAARAGDDSARYLYCEFFGDDSSVSRGLTNHQPSNVVNYRPSHFLQFDGSDSQSSEDDEVPGYDTSLPDAPSLHVSSDDEFHTRIALLHVHQVEPEPDDVRSIFKTRTPLSSTASEIVQKSRQIA